MKKFLFTVISLFLISIGYSQIVYSFIGYGNWSDTSNWYNRSVPPAKLLGGDTIFIKSNATCYLDINETIELGAGLIVENGAILDVMNNLVLQKNTDSIQYFIATVDSSYTDTLFFEASGKDYFTCNDQSCPITFASFIDTSSILETYLFTDPSFVLIDNFFPTTVFDGFLTIDSLPGDYIQDTTVSIYYVPDTVTKELRDYYIDAPFQIHITEYDSVGGYFSGNFSVVSNYYYVDEGIGPPSGPIYTNHLITCKFRAHRASNDASPWVIN